MAPPIRVEWLESREARDLVQALAVRGIVGTQVATKDRIGVVIHDPHEAEERLVAELVAALEGWLDDRRREPLRLRIGNRVRTVGSSRDLASALHEQAQAQAQRRAGRAGEDL